MGSLSQAVVETASTLKPAFEAIQALGPGQPGAESGLPGHEPTFSRSHLRVLADEFRADAPTRLPETSAEDRPGLMGRTADDRRACRRSTMRPSVDFTTLTSMAAPVVQPILNVTLRDATEAEWERFLMAVDYLLWDQADSMETRINRVLDDEDLGFRGFKDSVVMKLLAVCHPDRVLPAFPFTGDHGKARMLGAGALGAVSVDFSGPASDRVE